MRITVIGCGYVGLVTAACFAEMGNHVTCVDQNSERIDALSNGVCPLYEPGMEAMLATNLSGRRLAFTTQLNDALQDVEVVFIAVGTPCSDDGSADISQVLSVAAELGQLLNNPAVVVCKSTSPVGTACRVEAILEQQCQRRQLSWRPVVISNPEFLKEGAAIGDFMRPDRIIIGSSSEPANALMRELYAPFVRNHERILFMGRRDAELSKYAANAFLASRISFMNELAGLSSQLGVDIEQVRRAIGSDSRIGHHFIYAGCGYGGSCFPKDIKALLHMGKEHGEDMSMLHAVEARNDKQKHWLLQQITQRLGANLQGKIIALWGLAFKPGTDDIRDAPSLVLIDGLLRAGATIHAYDPVAMSKIAERYSLPVSRGQIQLMDEPYVTLQNADALVLVTEWKQFRQPDFSNMRKHMRLPLIIDGRNQYDPTQVREHGFEYAGVGRAAPKKHSQPVLRQVV
ncbi:UDP-glucose dehydrogenase family protein [Halopseudomonas pelagia]|uniref:UDP-glucose dehydrogenase family protein n=1 Tax=Halopseudomonas pelagia TaxID=553151 RepID=UPI00039BFA3C|nr:UDP-glucose/GDP-mannose dehydrogenase family protein [Halopseudomonas pelagia]